MSAGPNDAIRESLENSEGRPRARRLRFVAVAHFPPRGGGSSLSCALLFRGIAGRGHDVHLLSQITQETASYDADVDPSNPTSLSVDRYKVPFFLYRLYDVDEFVRFQQVESEAIRGTLPSLIDRVRPEFVVCAHETLAGSVIEIAHGKGLPCALMLRGSPTWRIVTNTYPKDMADRFLRLYASADVVIPVGRYMQDDLAARGIGGIHHIPNFLDIQKFSPGLRDESLLDRYGIAPDSKVVLHASLGLDRKRPLDVIESASIALPQAAKLFYLFAGGGERWAELEAIARDRGLGDRVRFVSNVPYEEMPDHIRLADIVALASEGEGISRVYLETQACGRVLIASDIPAGREIVDHGRTGLLFRTGDPADLAAQVLRAAEDPVLCAQIGDAARENAHQYDLERVIDRYVDLFTELSQDNGRLS